MIIIIAVITTAVCYPCACIPISSVRSLFEVAGVRKAGYVVKRVPLTRPLEE